MKPFLLVCTQHHILLALALIKQNSLKNAHIIFYMPTKALNNPTFFKKIQSLQKNMGFSITYINIKNKYHYWYLLLNPLKRMIAIRSTYTTIKNLISPWKSESKCFYFFYDASLVCQYIIQKYSKDKKNSFVLVQDGLAKYTEHRVTDKGAAATGHKILYYKLLFGFFWTPTCQLGDKYKYKTIHSLFPNLMLPKYLKIDKKIKIKSENLYSQELKVLSLEILQSKLPELFNHSEKSLIIFLPFFRLNKSSSISQIKKEIKNLINESSKSYTHIYIKNHPKNPIEILLDKETINTTFTIPSGIAAEHFFALEASDNINFITTPSTVVLLALASAHKKYTRVVFMESSPSTLLVKKNPNLMKAISTELGHFSIN